MEAKLEMNIIRLTANKRADFARERWHELVKSFHSTDTISGYKARKIAQAYRIYCHYLFVFNGSIPNQTAVFNVMEKYTARRKKNRFFKSPRQLALNKLDYLTQKDDEK